MILIVTRQVPSIQPVSADLKAGRVTDKETPVGTEFPSRISGGKEDSSASAPSTDHLADGRREAPAGPVRTVGTCRRSNLLHTLKKKKSC